MYYKLCSRMDAEILIQEIKPLLVKQGTDAIKIIKDISHYADVLEKNYGKEGKGGFIYFFCVPQKADDIRERVLREYNITQAEVEYQDIVEPIVVNGYKYIFELYIVSSDYNMVFIYPEGGE